MATRPARAALKEALSDWRRHVLALAGVVLVFGIAALVGSEGAYYGAALIAFVIWMGWFVLTAVEWIRLAEF
ncbi:hypothetical protein [Haloplanus aerogenes]|uniref:Uncharacterized protein n=1 Tax=Haloplanus aerogenes TaxID=660522 RepID=A0A3M0CWK7_9EURY|nr:hypothetical protein [Haloplanus aerogenes]AZH25195.1 hypothetical protein DU502_07290 [Haloplanus aerogenes]RMB13578.1 hypothetical protein ATH50_2017 [Haloplanus aerogenes]